MPERILLVEDDMAVRNMVSAVLTLEGYEVITARNGTEGLIAAMQQTPDLILLDVHMPAMSGIQMANLLKSEAGLRHVPIVILSALDEDQAIWKGYRVGVHSYITKPFEPMELLSVAGRVIRETKGHVVQDSSAVTTLRRRKSRLGAARPLDPKKLREAVLNK